MQSIRSIVPLIKLIKIGALQEMKKNDGVFVGVSGHRRKQKLNLSIDKAWNFFPINLSVEDVDYGNVYGATVARP